VGGAAFREKRIQHDRVEPRSRRCNIDPVHRLRGIRVGGLDEGQRSPTIIPNSTLKFQCYRLCVAETVTLHRGLAVTSWMRHASPAASWRAARAPHGQNKA